LDSFYGDGYLKFEELNFSRSLEILTRSLMPELSEALGQYPIKTGGEIWLDIHPGGRLDYEGELSLSKVPLNWLADDVPPVSDIKTILTGWYMPGRDWGARLQDLQFELGATSIDPINLLFTQQLGSNWQAFDVSINHVDLALLAELLNETQVLPAHTIDSIKRIQPKGNLSSLSMGRARTGYYLSANLDGCYMLPFKGIPGLKDIHGYLELQGSSGLFHIADSDGFEIFFPKSYRDYLAIDQAKGTVYFDWQSEDQLIVHSDQISTKVEAGDSQFMFSVERPRRGEQKTPNLNLLIGARDLDLTQTETYLPYTMAERSSNWVKNAVKGGNLKEFGLLLRSGPPKNNRLSRTIQLLFDTEQATVKFNPAWPQLDALEGLFLIDSGNLSAQIMSARLHRAAVTQARIEYSIQQPLAQRKWIIDGQLEADLSAMIDVLTQSPLNKKLGPMVNWAYAGDTLTRLHLELPASVEGQTPVPVSSYKATSVIHNGTVAVTGSAVELDALSGDIEFTSEKGIYSDNLKAALWDQPFSAKLYRAQNQQQMSFNTALTPNSLNRFFDFSWQNIISGTLPITAVLSKDPSAPSNTATLDIRSEMQAVAVHLPAPIGKLSEQTKALEMRLHFEPSLSRIEGRLGDLLLSDIRFDKGYFKRGVISYDRELILPDQDMLLISAYLPTIDLDLWRPFTDSIAQRSTGPKSWRTVFDLDLAYWKLSGLNLAEISAIIKPVHSGLEATFISNLADGKMILPWRRQQLPTINLNRLQLPKNLGDKTMTMDPRQLMAMDFSVDWLSVAGRDLGSLSFELRSEPSGASFNNISGDILGLKPGVYATEAPTDFFWGYDGQNHLSKLVGPIGIENIGELFSTFGLPQVLDSQSGRLDADLVWQGEPWAVSKENLQGDFKVSLINGNFYRTPGGAGTALKLVGLFNFANWLRRLQLDFSDVVGKNLAYNSLDGTLNFDRGVFSLDEPLKMKMPSGRMSMAGEFDLIHETVDAQLVATLPVATNLPWLVGLTGGLPAAFGVYVTSKLVEKQVDRISSISYKLSGPWDDVEVAVDKIFAAELPESNQSVNK